MNKSSIAGYGLVCAAAYTFAGCVGNLTALTPSSGKDMSAALDAGSDGMGSNADLPPPHFYPDIEAFLDSEPCASGGCHLAAAGGAMMPYLVKNATAAMDQGNYMNFYNEAITPASIADPTQSTVINFLLDKNGQHQGGIFLHETGDPNYTLIYSWIAAGGPQ